MPPIPRRKDYEDKRRRRVASARRKKEGVGVDKKRRQKLPGWAGENANHKLSGAMMQIEGSG